MVQEVLKHIFNTLLFLILTRNTQKLRWVLQMVMLGILENPGVGPMS